MVNRIPSLLRKAKWLVAILTRPVRPPLPLHATISIVRSCDQSCIMCRMPERTGAIEFMPVERFFSVYDQTVPQRLSLSGDGEPILHPELGAILRHAQRSMVSMTTHLKFLPVSPDELATWLSALKVSVDAATPEIYEMIRGGDLNQTSRNVASVVAATRRNPHAKCQVRLHFVVQRDNQHEIAPFVRLAARLGANSVLFIRAKVPGPPGHVDPGIAEMDPEVLLPSIEEGKAEASRLGIKTNLQSLQYRRGSSENAVRPWNQEVVSGLLSKLKAFSRLKCVYPWLSTTVQPSGTVLPCCLLSESEDQNMVVGDVSKTRFAQVWHGERYARLRHALTKGEGLETYACHGCPLPMDVLELIRYAKVLVPGVLGP